MSAVNSLQLTRDLRMNLGADLRGGVCSPKRELAGYSGS